MNVTKLNHTGQILNLNDVVTFLWEVFVCFIFVIYARTSNNVFLKKSIKYRAERSC